MLSEQQLPIPDHHEGGEPGKPTHHQTETHPSIKSGYAMACGHVPTHPDKPPPRMSYRPA